MCPPPAWWLRLPETSTGEAASVPTSSPLTCMTLEAGLGRRGPGQSRGGSASCSAPSTLRRQMISEPLAYLHLCWTPGLMIRQAGPQSHGGSPQVLSQVLAAGDQGWGAWKATGALPSGHTVHHSPGQGALPARARLGQGRSLWPPSGEAT